MPTNNPQLHAAITDAHKFTKGKFKLLHNLSKDGFIRLAGGSDYDIDFSFYLATCEEILNKWWESLELCQNIDEQELVKEQAEQVLNLALQIRVAGLDMGNEKWDLLCAHIKLHKSSFLEGRPICLRQLDLSFIEIPPKVEYLSELSEADIEGSNFTNCNFDASDPSYSFPFNVDGKIVCMMGIDYMAKEYTTQYFYECDPTNDYFIKDALDLSDYFKETLTGKIDGYPWMVDCAVEILRTTDDKIEQITFEEFDVDEQYLEERDAQETFPTMYKFTSEYITQSEAQELKTALKKQLAKLHEKRPEIFSEESIKYLSGNGVVSRAALVESGRHR